MEEKKAVSLVTRDYRIEILEIIRGNYTDEERKARLLSYHDNDMAGAMDELSPEDKILVKRARKAQRFMSQPFHVAESFTGMQGAYVPLEKTIDGMESILSGECDDIPEQCFLMSADMDDVFKKYKDEK